MAAPLEMWRTGSNGVFPHDRRTNTRHCRAATAPPRRQRVVGAGYSGGVPSPSPGSSQSSGCAADLSPACSGYATGAAAAAAAASARSRHADMLADTGMPSTSSVFMIAALLERITCRGLA